MLSIGTSYSQNITEPDGNSTGHDLIGQVVDAAGFGISGATVWIIGNEGRAFNATTNITGYYGFNVASGNYTITAELPGFSFTSAASQVRPGTTVLAPRIIGYSAANVTMTNITAPNAFNLYPSGSAYSSGATSSPAYYTGTNGIGWAQGRIVDRSGAPIPFAGIGVDGFPASASTDAQGNYRIALSAGMHTLEPMKSGYGIPPRVVFITPGNITNFDLTGSKTIVLG
ncbi:MAG: carboxypeptidase-like regulatory domain-containing protein [Methanotrichaceae archaeon]